MVGGRGMEVATGGKLDVARGNLTMEGPLKSEGQVEVGAGGRISFSSTQTSRIGGAGLKSEADSSVELGGGEMQLDGPLQAAGKIEVSAGGKLSLRSAGNSRISGNESLQLRKGGQVELAAGTLEIESQIESEGMLHVNGGEMKFTQATGKSKIGGSGMIVQADATVDVEQGDVEFGKDAPLKSTGEVKVGGNGTVSFGESARFSNIQFPGSLADVPNQTEFEAEFRTKVSDVLGVHASRVDITQMANRTGEAYFDTKYRILDIAGDGAFDERTDEERQTALETLTIGTKRVARADPDLVASPNTIGGKGMFVQDGGRVELKEKAVVNFENISSEGLLDLKEGSEASFDSRSWDEPSMIRGEGIRSSGKLDVNGGRVVIEAPVRSTGNNSRVSVKSGAELGIQPKDEGIVYVTGDVNTDVNALKDQFSADLASELRIAHERVRILGVKQHVENRSTWRRRLESSAFVVTFTIRRDMNLTDRHQRDLEQGEKM